MPTFSISKLKEYSKNKYDDGSFKNYTITNRRLCIVSFMPDQATDIFLEW